MKPHAPPSPPLIRWFGDIKIEDVPLVGGKNASLGEMYRAHSLRTWTTDGQFLPRSGGGFSRGGLMFQPFQPGPQFIPSSSQIMNRIQVYDPAMCCSSGVCGTDIDPDLVGFAALLAALRTRGVVVERSNLGQQPLAFAQNSTVKALLERDGPGALPVILLNGELYLNGRYPTAVERPVLFRLGVNANDPAAS